MLCSKNTVFIKIISIFKSFKSFLNEILFKRKADNSCLSVNLPQVARYLKELQVKG